LGERSIILPTSATKQVRICLWVTIEQVPSNSIRVTATVSVGLPGIY
jgi:hypothetical protein